MKDYSILEAIKIIENCNESNIGETRHFNIRNIQRTIDLGLVHDTFLNNPLMGILKQDYNIFRVYFEHETKSSKDISIVFEIDDDENIRFITVILTLRDKRVKNHGES